MGRVAPIRSGETALDATDPECKRRDVDMPEKGRPSWATVTSESVGISLIDDRGVVVFSGSHTHELFQLFIEVRGGSHECNYRTRLRGRGRCSQSGVGAAGPDHHLSTAAGSRSKGFTEITAAVQLSPVGRRTE